MSAVQPGIYKAILRVRQAWGFDVGGVLMRFYYYMTNIGVVTMLTLSGYSFFMAGLVSSTIALAVFLVSPRIAKAIDERGQGAVLPKATCLPVAGTLGMLACVGLHGPAWLLFPLAALMGSTAAPQALVRARWTYLIRTRKLGKGAPSLHGVLSYEAVLDDVGFMVAPALSIFLASIIMPLAGLAFGIAAYVAGAALITLSRSTEPVPGWTPPSEETPAEGNPPGAEGEPPAVEGTELLDTAAMADAAGAPEAAPTAPAKEPSIFRTSSVVRILFVMMLVLGMFFGGLDASQVAFGEMMGDPNIASMALILQSAASVTMGFVFGMVKLPFRQSTQLVLSAVLFGCTFACCAFIHSTASLFLILTPAALFYAPFLITVNATCEGAVPGRRFTEAITWVNAGATCGMALGPTLAGAIIETAGTYASFQAEGAIVLITAILAVAFIPTLRKNVR